MTIVLVACFFMFAVTLTIIIAVALIKGLFNYSINGQKEFDAFKKNTVDIKSLGIISVINGLSVYKKIITKKYYSDCIIVCRSGVILIKYWNYSGEVNGSDDLPVIELKLNGKLIKINNEFYKIREEKNKLAAKVNSDFYEVIIKPDDMKIKLKYDSNIVVCTMSQLFYKLDKLTKSKKYTENEVNDIYKKLVM